MQSLPAALHDVVVSAYNDALTPVFAWLAPIVLINVILSFGFRGPDPGPFVHTDGGQGRATSAV